MLIFEHEHKRTLVYDYSRIHTVTTTKDTLFVNVAGFLKAEF